MGDLLSHTSLGNGAYLILADVSLGEFWLSSSEGPLVFSLSVAPVFVDSHC